MSELVKTLVDQQVSERRAFSVLGTPLLATDYAELTEFCRTLAQQPRVTALEFVNTHIVTLRRHDPAFAAITSVTDHFLPDGMPLVWCLNRQGARLSDRVYGPEFMRYFIQASSAQHTHYFLGGSPECLERLSASFRKANPSVVIVGGRHGYFKPEEEEAIAEEINQLSPDFIWVGLGTPKQQAWIHRNKNRLARGVMFSVGFAFDVHAGLKSDAPAWMQRCGLTWLFRLGSEPRRLGGRYLKYNSLFLWYLLRDGSGGKAAGPTHGGRA